MLARLGAVPVTVGIIHKTTLGEPPTCALFHTLMLAPPGPMSCQVPDEACEHVTVGADHCAFLRRSQQRRGRFGWRAFGQLGQVDVSELEPVGQRSHSLDASQKWAGKDLARSVFGEVFGERLRLEDAFMADRSLVVRPGPVGSVPGMGMADDVDHVVLMVDRRNARSGS